jgi:hypothetical protein
LPGPDIIKPFLGINLTRIYTVLMEITGKKVLKVLALGSITSKAGIKSKNIFDHLIPFPRESTRGMCYKFLMVIIILSKP